MTEIADKWKQLAEQETLRRQEAEKSQAEMRRFLLEYFYLLGSDPRQNMSLLVAALGKVLDSAMALYNRLDSGVVKTWCIDHEPEGFTREVLPEESLCYNMTIKKRGPDNLSPVVLNDLEGTIWQETDANIRKYNLQAYLGFPLLLEGQVVGSLCVFEREKRIYSNHEISILGAFASALRLEEERLLSQNRLAQAKMELQRKNEEIERLILRDPLTGLPNRKAMVGYVKAEIATLQRRLISEKTSITTGQQDKKKREKEQKRAKGQGFALLLCDIDFFKTINDTYGHSCGDDVLKGISTTLAKELRPHDKVARWGGEEFLILLHDTSTSSAGLVAERLRTAVSRIVFFHGGNFFQTTMTFGLYICQSGEMDMDTCVLAADRALSIGKKSGRNCVVISDGTYSLVHEP